jgi:hypothetical protein
VTLRATATAECVTLRATATAECVTLRASRPEAASPARCAGAASPPPSRGCSTTHPWGHRVGSAPRAVARPPTGGAEQGSRKALHCSAGEAEVDVSLPTSDRGVGSVRTPVLDPGPGGPPCSASRSSNTPDLVPCCWRNGGPMLLASDTGGPARPEPRQLHHRAGDQGGTGGRER